LALALAVTDEMIAEEDADQRVWCDLEDEELALSTTREVSGAELDSER
jgi:hypothetical protein